MSEKTIWKYTLDLEAGWWLDMPRGAKVLNVAGVDGEICLWALVDPAEEKGTRYFWIYGTGHPISPGATHTNYLGTAVLEPYVWHVFE
jgi:hypothetical protein